MVGLSTIICNVAWVTRSGRPKDEVKEASPSVWPSPLSDVQKTSVLLGDGFPYRVRRQIKCQWYQFNLLLTKYLHCSHFPNLCSVAKISIFSEDVWQLALIGPHCIHASSNLPPPLLFDFPPYLKMSNWWARPLLRLKWISLTHLPVLPPDMFAVCCKNLVIFNFASTDFGEKLAKRIKLCT